VFAFVVFQFFSIKPRHWLGRMCTNWPILCRVGRKTTTQSIPVAFTDRTRAGASVLMVLKFVNCLLCSGFNWDLVPASETYLMVMCRKVTGRYTWLRCSVKARSSSYCYAVEPTSTLLHSASTFVDKGRHFNNNSRVSYLLTQVCRQCLCVHKFGFLL